MANISSASGYITIKAKSKKTIRSLFEELNDVLGNDVNAYGTYLNPTDIAFYKLENGDLVGECYFEGSGRWAYSCNISYIGNWLKNDPVFEKNAWDMKFDYSDEEIGARVLYTAVATIHHNKGQKLHTLKANEDTYHQYKYNVDNLMTVMGYDQDYAEELIGSCY